VRQRVPQTTGRCSAPDQPAAAAAHRRLPVERPDELAAQLAVVINGAFVSAQILAADDATSILLQMAHALIAAARGPRT
jgi:hypothetical protein